MNEEKYVEMLENGELYDYITNLQQENERLKWDKEQLNSLVNSCQDEIRKLKERIKHYEETTTFGDYVKEVNLLVDYKSRVEKAVEYIKNCPEYLWANVNTKELLNILNVKGSDE